MPIYSYIAINASGKRIKGKEEVASIEELKSLLKTHGMVAVHIGDASTSSNQKQRHLRSRVKNHDLIMFTRQLSVLIRSGVPLIEALGICMRQSNSQELASVIGAIQHEIENGMAFSKSLEAHPTVFNNIYRALIKAGEESGSLDEILKQLAQILAYEQQVKKEIKSALRYPTAVVFFLIAAFVLILQFVIPKMTAIFSAAKADLPLPTRICITLNELISNYWYLLIGATLGIIWLLIRAKRTEKGAYIFDKVKLKIPYLGTLITQSIMYRFSYIYSILIKSGISVLNSMEILADVVDNVAISREFTKIKANIEQGDTVSRQIKKSPYFTEMIGSMIAVGENSGDMERLLFEAADFYNMEMKQAIKNITDILPIILTVLLAVIVGFFALAIYLPLFQISKMAGGL